MHQVIKIFDKDKALAYREQLKSRTFADGAATYLGNTEKMKSNTEFHPDVNDQFRIDLQRDFQSVPEVAQFCMPYKILGPFVNRYADGDFYGKHVDNVEMQGPTRIDISFTLFLSDPDEYEGGDLELDVGSEPALVKLPAGQAIFYPAGTMHQVMPVTAGERLCAVGWMQSRVRDPHKRQMLYELNTAVDTYIREHGMDETGLSLQSVRGKLTQMWVEY